MACAAAISDVQAAPGHASRRRPSPASRRTPAVPEAAQVARGAAARRWERARGPSSRPTTCNGHTPVKRAWIEKRRSVTQKHARLALFRATRSRVRGAWPPARLALTRPASASRLAEHAMGPPGAALLARCAAQSCEKQGGLLSLSMAQRGCWCSRAAVQWREGLIGGDLVLLQRAQHAPSPGAETCWWATGASFSVLSLALCSMSQYSCCADRRAGRVVPRVEREARGARLSVNPAAHARRQGCSTGDWHCGDAVAVTPTLLCRSKAPVLCFFAAEI